MPVKHLLLLRHGEAHHSSPDELRELSEAGRKEVSNTLNKALNRIPPRIQSIGAIYHSGFTRAVQTADIAASVIADNSAIVITPKMLEGITPWGQPSQFSMLLEKKSAETVLIVTHNPFVEDLVSYLSGQDIRITTGTLVYLQVDFLAQGCCKLVLTER